MIGRADGSWHGSSTASGFSQSPELPGAGVITMAIQQSATEPVSFPSPANADGIVTQPSLMLVLSPGQAESRLSLLPRGLGHDENIYRGKYCTPFVYLESV